MKLWLDDTRPVPEGWAAVKAPRDAIRLLSTGWVEEEDTGYKVEEMAFLGMIPRLKWSIHSQNPVGRERILACLIKAEIFWSESIVAS